MYTAAFRSNDLVQLDRRGHETWRWALPGATGTLQVGERGRHGWMWVTDPLGGKVFSVDVRHCGPGR